MRRESREYRSSFDAAKKSNTIRLPLGHLHFMSSAHNFIPLLIVKEIHLIGKIRFYEELKSKTQTWIVGPIHTQTGSHSFAELNLVVILRKSYHYSSLGNHYLILSSTKN